MMKKMIVLLIAITAMVSCKNDDDSSGLDPIIGSWYWIGATQNGNQLELSDCDKEDFFEFSAPNTFAFFTHTDIPNNAQQCNRGESRGTWTKTGENTYTIDSETIIPVVV